MENSALRISLRKHGFVLMPRYGVLFQPLVEKFTFSSL
jgi:hypothetical protein